MPFTMTEEAWEGKGEVGRLDAESEKPISQVDTSVQLKKTSFE